MLQQLWVQLVLNQFNSIVRINGRLIIVGDGIKIGRFDGGAIFKQLVN